MNSLHVIVYRAVTVLSLDCNGYWPLVMSKDLQGRYDHWEGSLLDNIRFSSILDNIRFSLLDKNSTYYIVFN